MTGSLRQLYLKRRLYLGLIASAMLCFLAVIDEVFLVFGFGALCLVVGITVAEVMILFGKNGITGSRITPIRFSNGDENPVIIEVANSYGLKSYLEIIDEIPVQFQRRDLQWNITLEPGLQNRIVYNLKPVKRGEYVFGALHVFASTELNFIARRYSFEGETPVKVYPSFMKLREYAFLAFDNRLQESGVKRIRRLGHTLEFEHIKEYVPGDDTRALNWKATARTGKPMVNQYEDERSQPVYCVIDKGRLMQMPFDGMTLLDYAINASLVMSYVAIHKGDKAGLLTFADHVSTYIEPGRRQGQMHRLSEALYNEQTKFPEADFERLFIAVTRRVRTRSLLLLLTNFSSLDGLNRQLPYLLKMARKHVLVVIFFENTALADLSSKRPSSVREIYHLTLAEKYRFEQSVIVHMLRKRGIYAILTKPSQLTVDLINEYIALKAKGTI